MARRSAASSACWTRLALFAIAYGEIGSSIYVALGIVAALGPRPHAGRPRLHRIVFGLVALSYAEGTAAIPETGGARSFTRRAFNDLCRIRHRVGALFLDYLIVIALSALLRAALRSAPCWRRTA